MTPLLSHNKIGVGLLSVALVISVAQTISSNPAQLASLNPASLIVLSAFCLLPGLLIFLIAKGENWALLILILCYLFFLPIRFKGIEEIDSLSSRLDLIQWSAVTAILQAVGVVYLTSHRRFLAGMIVGCLIWVGYFVVQAPYGLDSGLILALPLYVAIPCCLSLLLGLVLSTKHMANRWHSGSLLPSAMLVLSVSGVILIFLESEVSPQSEFGTLWKILGVFGLLFTIVNWPDPSRIRGITNVSPNKFFLR